VSDTSSTDPGDGSPGPTNPSKRIVSIDVLRGFALLGILVINVWFFSMPLAAVTDPTVFGGFGGADYAAWLLGHVLFEQKFMTLFTLLFGAGIVLFTASKERRGQPVLRLHYRRTGLLILVGLGHAYLLWYGDILVAYGVCALVVVGARDWDPALQVRAGLALVSVPALLNFGLGLLTLLSSSGGGAIRRFSEAEIRAEIDTYRGGWLEQMDHRVPTALEFQTSQFLLLTFWRVSGLMLVGMALYRWGVLSNDRSERFYRRLLAAGATLGLAAILAGVWFRTQYGWSSPGAVFFGMQFNYWGSLPLAGAYVAGVMLWCRHRVGGAVSGVLSAVGRTAFSNYLLQTVLATSVFYGHGLGLFGSVSRFEQLGVVVLIWAIQVPLSVLWLRYFRFGPVEWVWRTLTYGQRQPLRTE